MSVRADCTSEQTSSLLRGGDVTTHAGRRRVHCVGDPVGRCPLLLKLSDRLLLVRYRLRNRDAQLSRRKCVMFLRNRRLHETLTEVFKILTAKYDATLFIINDCIYVYQ